MTDEQSPMPSDLTPAMRSVVEYFEALGPRWGLQPKACAVHALLYLTGRPMSVEEVAETLGLGASETRTAFDDLISWRVVAPDPQGRLATNGEPWDLLFAGMEERRRREIGPALDAIGTAAKQAGTDGTPRSTQVRINALHALLGDLTALGDQMGRMPASALKGLVRIGGRVSKLIGR
jgi:DNA-binding transcriptional regulator GbsR (MarR family)